MFLLRQRNVDSEKLLVEVFDVRFLMKLRDLEEEQQIAYSVVCVDFHSFNLYAVVIIVGFSYSNSVMNLNYNTITNLKSYSKGF